MKATKTKGLEGPNEATHSMMPFLIPLEVFLLFPSLQDIANTSLQILPSAFIKTGHFLICHIALTPFLSPETSRCAFHILFD